MKRVAIILSFLLTISITVSASSIFEDVIDNDWFASHVYNLYDYGIVNGHDGQFNPNQPVTRAQIAKMLDYTIQYVRTQEDLREQNQNKIDTHDEKIISAAMKTTQSVVQITDGNKVNGTGFIVKGNKIVTNYHVIDEIQSPYIITSNGKEYEAKVIKQHEDLDLALLSIQEEQELSYLKFAEDVREGSTCIIIGHPLGLTNTITKGIVSHANRGAYIQVDAAISRGNSGSPIVNSEGEVIAIATSKIVDQGVEGIGFGVYKGFINSFVGD